MAKDVTILLVACKAAHTLLGSIYDYRPLRFKTVRLPA